MAFEAPSIPKREAMLQRLMERQGQKLTEQEIRSREHLQAECEYVLTSQGIHRFGGHPEPDTTLNLDTPFPPSCKDLEKLQPIFIDELTLETHHSGRVMIVRVCGNAYGWAGGVFNVGEDANMNATRIKVFNFPVDIKPKEILPRGRIFAIKEPFLTAVDGNPGVQIQHPSDMVELSLANPAVPKELGFDERFLETCASVYNLHGCEVYDKGNVQAAFLSWSQGLKQITADDKPCTSHVLHANLSEGLLWLGRWEASIENAMKSLIPGDDLSKEQKTHNSVAHIRIGRAAYGLRDYEMAKVHFQASLKIKPDEPRAALYLGRSNMRLKEQENGIFDLSFMHSQALREQPVPTLDHGSFTRHTALGPVTRSPRGIYAKQDFAKGAFVLVEKAYYTAFHRPSSYNNNWIVNVGTGRVANGGHAACLAGVVDRMICNPAEASKVLGVISASTSDSQVPVTDGLGSIDVFKLQELLETRTFVFDANKPLHNYGNVGFWVHASAIREGCIFNAQYTFHGDMLAIRATKNIGVGEEIVIPHQPGIVNHVRWSKENLRDYGAECKCKLCLAESTISTAVLEVQTRLCAEAETLMSQNALDQKPREMSATDITNGERILRELIATYDGNNTHMFVGFPKVLVVNLALWMARAYHCSSSCPADKLLVKGTRVLRLLGYRIDYNHYTKKFLINEANAIPCPYAIHAAMIMKHACEWAGNLGAAHELYGFARATFYALYGTYTGFAPQFQV